MEAQATAHPEHRHGEARLCLDKLRVWGPTALSTTGQPHHNTSERLSHGPIYTNLETLPMIWHRVWLEGASLHSFTEFFHNSQMTQVFQRVFKKDMEKVYYEKTMYGFLKFLAPK